MGEIIVTRNLHFIQEKDMILHPLSPDVTIDLPEDDEEDTMDLPTHQDGYNAECTFLDEDSVDANTGPQCNPPPPQ